MAYLLRLWQVRCRDGWTWRALLESAHRGKPVGFASTEELFCYLRRQMAQGEGLGDEGTVGGQGERRTGEPREEDEGGQTMDSCD